MTAGRLVLASRSPQRRAILTQLGVEFDVAPADVDELEAGDPRDLVTENARRKADAVPGELVLGVDTTVALGGRSFGKPRDRDDAEATLRELSGREHAVWSGLALRSGGQTEVSAACTRVRFRALSDAELAWYLDSGEWRERAGAYAIQGRGAALVERIDGDFFNVVGLPVPELVRLAPWLLTGTPPSAGKRRNSGHGVR